MATSISSNQWNTPRRSSASPTVVSIPAHFFGPDNRKTDKALLIQKVFRGFVVRKNMRKIACLKREVKEIEMRISTKEVRDLIRKDSKERLKESEMLMSLLLRLDAVRGVDSGVREFRKSVIKKAIALQEAVDAVVSDLETAEDEIIVTEVDSVTEQAVEDTDMVDQTCECENLADQKSITEVESTHDSVEFEVIFEDLNNPDKKSVTKPIDESHEIDKESVSEDAKVSHEIVKESLSEDAKACHEIVKESVSEDAKVVDKNEQSQSNNASSVNPESSSEGGEINHGPNPEDERITKDDPNESHTVLLEKMISMMKDLSEKNEKQSHLIGTLSQKVEMLEKALVCDSLRRMKKRNACGSIDGCDKCLGTNKQGKRK